MLRYRLAGPWLAARRALRLATGGAAPGFRILLLHDVAARLALLDRLVTQVKRDHGILSPEEAEAWLSDRHGRSPQAGRLPCLLSFDDGFASNHAAATEVLAKHRVKALFFVCPGLLDLPPETQRRRVAETVFDGGPGAGGRLMTWAEIEDLKADGHAIGAHGMTHRRLSMLEGEALRHEIAESGRRLGERLGAAVPWFAYPFGDLGSISAAALAVIAADYRFCRSGVRGANHADTPRLALRADHVELEAPERYRAMVLDGGLDFRYRGARRRLDAMVQAQQETSDSASAV